MWLCVSGCAREQPVCLLSVCVRLCVCVHNCYLALHTVTAILPSFHCLTATHHWLSTTLATENVTPHRRHTRSCITVTITDLTTTSSNPLVPSNARA